METVKFKIFRLGIAYVYKNPFSKYTMKINLYSIFKSIDVLDSLYFIET